MLYTKRKKIIYFKSKGILIEELVFDKIYAVYLSISFK